MVCLNETLTGKCELFNPQVGRDSNVSQPEGCDAKGNCRCTSDPNPAETCCDYESDNVCVTCGIDLNVEECECDRDWEADALNEWEDED